MTDRPLISIIMPAYNAEKYIKTAVESAAAQTYENWELIIVDDQSSDHTPAILDQLQSDKIRVFHNKENHRTAWTRNFAVKQAQGDWVAFLDADDAWEPEKLQKQISILKQQPDASLLFTGSAFMNESGERLNYILHVPARIGYDEILKQNLISCSSVLVRKECVLAHPFPEEEIIHEDFAVWLSILREVPYAYGTDEPLLIYRLSAAGKSHNKLKAAQMNWNTYRYCGLSFTKALASMISYTIRSFKKYSQLK